jgi:hypothetical protein
MIRILLSLGLTFLVASTPLAAQEVTRDGRYALVPQGDGFLRLDTRSGEVSRCTGDIGQLACRLLPDERMAYEEELRRLEERLGMLERRVGLLEVPAVPPAPADPPAPVDPPALTEELPTDNEVDRVMNIAEQVMRRFFAMVKELREEFGR